MRKLNAGDLFKAARMIKRMGIKEDLKNFSEKPKEEKSSF